LVAACNHQSATKKDIVWKIDPKSAKKMDMTALFDSIWFIPLETNDSCLIKMVHQLVHKDGIFYVRNTLSEVIAFDHDGRFLYTTKGSTGRGPNEYILAQTFNVLDDGTLAIFDAYVRKIKYYKHPQGIVSTYALPNDILPVTEMVKINADTFLLADPHPKESKFKFYSKKQKRVFKAYTDKQPVEFYAPRKEALFRYNNVIYCDPQYPSNMLYKLNEQLEMELVMQLDFGAANFSMDYLPKDKERIGFNYVDEHSNYVYPNTKYDLENSSWVFFYHEPRHAAVAYRDKRTNETIVFKNIPNSGTMLPRLTLLNNDCFYCICEPTSLYYLVDKRLMSEADIERIKMLKEDDNPIITIYRMKNP
jgi:hypothetical protein